MKYINIKNIFKTLLISSVILFAFNVLSITTLDTSSAFLTTRIAETNINFTTSTNLLMEVVNNYEPISFIELSNDELMALSTCDYDTRLELLYNENYTLEDRLNIFLGNNIDNCALIYYDINSEDLISINADLEFTAASTYKVGLNLLYYYLALTNEISLDDTISYQSSDYEEGTGILCSNASIGSYSIQNLLDLSIIYSDNIATNMLGRYLGGHAAIRSNLYQLLNIDYTSKGNKITPNIEFEILKFIYANRENSNFAHLLEVLTQTKFNDRMDKYIPTEITAHKIGTYGCYIHDVGIILDDNPYILIMYTNNVDNAAEKIAQVSKSIYETR